MASELANKDEAIEAARRKLGADADDDVSVEWGDGHDGVGWYAWFTEYPEEGSERVG